jgi:hypothetical protein
LPVIDHGAARGFGGAAGGFGGATGGLGGATGAFGAVLLPTTDTLMTPLLSLLITARIDVIADLLSLT